MQSVAGFRVRVERHAVEVRPSAALRVVCGAVAGAVGFALLFAEGGAVPYEAFLAAGLLLVAAATWLVLRRDGVTVDAVADRVETWRSVTTRRSVASARLSAFREVGVGTEVRGHGKHAVRVHPIRLRGDETFEIAAPTDAAGARRLAEHIARAAHLPLREELGDEVVVRDPARLDWSLRETLRESGVPPCPTRPADSRLEVHVADLRHTVALPALGLVRGGLLLLGLALPGCVMGIVVATTIAGDAPAPIRALFVAASFAPVLFTSLLAAHRGLRRTTVEIAPKAIRIRSEWPWTARTRVVACDRLEGVTASRAAERPHALAALVPTGGVSLVCDAEIVRFGAGLPDADLAYLRDLVRHVVCADDPDATIELRPELLRAHAWA